MTATTSRTIGRFAPSPTGPLHQGSLLAAMASYLSAHVQGGRWLLRMEDVDSTRSRPHYASLILRQMEALGFVWEGDVWYQSARQEIYHAVLAQLRQQGHLYACACRRVTRTRAGHAEPCRALGWPLDAQHAWRLRMDKTDGHILDRVQGSHRWHMRAGTADVILKRADGLIAYALAVVVDDELQGVTEVVRGADLMEATPAQQYIQSVLGYRALVYAHVPVLLGADGRKLSKRDAAPALEPAQALADLLQAWRDLGQIALAPCGNVAEFWAQAVCAWNEARVPRRMAGSSPIFAGS